MYIAAFAVSAYSSTYHRAGCKPFNPVLGETYECERPDRGFRFISEQVWAQGATWPRPGSTGASRGQGLGERIWQSGRELLLWVGAGLEISSCCAVFWSWDHGSA